MINNSNRNYITYALVLASFLGVAVSYMSYKNNKEHQEIARQNMILEREIKQLQLANEKRNAKASGLIGKNY
jgi:hypothetical protein